MRKIITSGILLQSIILVIFVSGLTKVACAQGGEYSTPELCKERRGLEYGAVAGIYISGGKSAEFYSGKPGNENNVNYVFLNKYRYDEIRQLLNFNDTAFILEYPGKMRYTPAFSFGLFVKYDLNCRTGIYLQFSYAKLSAKDVVTIEVDPPDYLTEPDIRLLPISGIEERNLVDLGFTHAFGNSKTARFTLGGGINMNNSLVKEHVLRIAEKPFSLVNIYGSNSYVPGTQQGYEMRQGGIGFGIFGTIGARFEFSPAIAIEPGLTVYYKQIKIDPAAGFTPHYTFFVKLCFRDLISFAE